MKVASRIRTAVILTALALTARVALSQTAIVTFWLHETVDNPGDSSVGYFSSTVIDAAGRPQIAYYDFHHNALRYAKKTAAGSWLKETIDAPGFPASAGDNVSLALDSSGQAHVTYYYTVNLNNVTADVRYARRFCSNPAQDVGCQWIKQTVETGVIAPGSGGSTSLAIDGSGRPNVVYFDDWRDQLKWARWEGSTWGIADVAPAVGGRASMVLDSAGLPRIAFTDNSFLPPRLKYAKVTCTFILCGWTLETVGSGVIGNLALDAAGAVQIVYRDPNYVIRYGLKSCSSCAWTSQVIGSTGNQETRPWIAVTSIGAPRVIFGDSNGSLNYARQQNGVWVTKVIASFVVPYADMSVTLEVGNRAHVTYQSSQNPYVFPLKHATEYSVIDVPRK